MHHAARLLEPEDRRALDNVNTPEEYVRASAQPTTAHAMQLKIQYFALMREQVGPLRRDRRNTGVDPGGSLR